MSWHGASLAGEYQLIARHAFFELMLTMGARHGQDLNPGSHGYETSVSPLSDPAFLQSTQLLVNDQRELAVVFLHLSHIC